MPETKPPRRTQVERTRQRKEQIIRAAFQHFGQYGYHGARLSEIASAAGVTEPGLLHHFPSKVHLLTEVLAERDRLDSLRFSLADLPENGDALSLLQKLVEYNQTVPGLVQLFTVLVAESIEEQHPGHEFFRQRYQHGREENTKMIREAQANGEIRADIPAEDLAIMLYAMMDGLQIQMLYEPEKVDMARVFQHFIHLLHG